ncbi:MAG: ASCH domain-containing protein [Desulfobulbaceae bacterium]|nr:MAG: ASCH domain-containing protein [Desulfobulbaceae bacterium]
MNIQRLNEKYPNNEKFKLGDNEALCAELTDLVRSGRKTATCGALRDFRQGNEVMPVVGRIDIVLNWDGTPALAIKTKSIEIMRFCDVYEQFALLEGENDSLDEWQEDHKRYFERNGGFDESMELVCECFELVEVF